MPENARRGNATASAGKHPTHWLDCAFLSDPISMSSFTHLDSKGQARMVDVGAKPETSRLAVASGCVRMTPSTLDLLQDDAAPKGDVLAVARVAGIQAAKRCDELIPLCHSLGLDSVSIEFYPDPALPGIRIEASCRVRGRTGVEMEALTAVTVAALTIYDMCKAVDRSIVIEGVCLERKSGGRSGDWERGDDGQLEAETRS
jgi:cyclic pyranopterin phosphate synthase